MPNEAPPHNATLDRLRTIGINLRPLVTRRSATSSLPPSYAFPAASGPKPGVPQDAYRGRSPQRMARVDVPFSAATAAHVCMKVAVVDGSDRKKLGSVNPPALSSNPP